MRSASLIVERGGDRQEVPLTVTHEGEVSSIAGALDVPHAAAWWPHTHGEPALYTTGLRVWLDADGAEAIDVELGRVGFRQVELIREGGRFAFRLNGRDIFCRGSSWTPLDCVSLQAEPEALHSALLRVRDAGMNMLRIAGPLVYESDAFFDLCDSLGILVWQDFMFANMDYPTDDEVFAAGVEAEVRQQLGRLQGRPSLTLLCGNSEGAQQAAMSGGSRDCWAPPFFETQLAAWARELCPQVPYCSSSTHGGAFPFQATEGVDLVLWRWRVPADAGGCAPRGAALCLGMPGVRQCAGGGDVDRACGRGQPSLSPASLERNACRGIWAQVGISTTCAIIT